MGNRVKEEVRVSGGGMGFLSVLCIVFIVLKLLDVITWSWVWVLASLWVSCAIRLVIFIGFVVYAVWLSKH